MTDQTQRSDDLHQTILGAISGSRGELRGAPAPQNDLTQTPQGQPPEQQEETNVHVPLTRFEEVIGEKNTLEAQLKEERSRREAVESRLQEQDRQKQLEQLGEMLPEGSDKWSEKDRVGFLVDKAMEIMRTPQEPKAEESSEVQSLREEFRNMDTRMTLVSELGLTPDQAKAVLDVKQQTGLQDIREAMTIASSRQPELFAKAAAVPQANVSPVPPSHNVLPPQRGSGAEYVPGPEAEDPYMQSMQKFDRAHQLETAARQRGEPSYGAAQAKEQAIMEMMSHHLYHRHLAKFGVPRMG